MTWVAAAVVGGAVVGAVGSNMAAGKQAQGQEQAAATQQGMFNTINQEEQPFVQGGYGAETSLQNLLYGTPGGTDAGTGLANGYLSQTFNPTQQQLNDYPGYQFQLQTGGQALENANTPGVGALSGPALKSLMSFNQGLAGTNYQNYFDQFQTQQNNIFNRLSSIAGLGQSAGAQVANSGTQLGTGIAQAQAGAAASQAGGIVGATNSLSGSANTLAGLIYAGGVGSGSAQTAASFANGSTYTSPDGYTVNLPGGG